MRIFTQKFFRLPLIDQTVAVNAALRELRNERYLSDEGKRKFRAAARRLERKARRLGIYVKDQR